MTLHLRQICLVARELSPAIADLRDVLGIDPCFVDEGVGVFGLENTLLCVGRNFLEVVAPVRDGTAAGRYLDRRGGDGGYMVICQTGDAETQTACRHRAARAGVRVAWEHVAGSHHMMQLHPGDLRAAFLEIDWEAHGELEGYWGAAGGRAWEPHVRTDVVADFAGVELQDPDPHGLADLWSRVMGLPVASVDGEPCLQLENARIRFVPDRDGRGPGLRGVDLVVADRARVREAAKRHGALVSDDVVLLCGTRFNLC
jgi:hypothetical protein